MFVGETGVGRTIQRTCEAMKAAKIEDPSAIGKVRALGVIDLPTIQKKLNLHYSLTLDLFGAEISTNSANFYNAGLKGRFQETKIEDDHELTEAVYPVLKLVDGQIVKVEEPAGSSAGIRSLRGKASNFALSCLTSRSTARLGNSATSTSRQRA